jgi:hypothetical protein
MNKYLVIFSSLLLLNITSECVANETRVADKLLKKFDTLIQGEFDNYNQINFETNDFLDKRDKPTDKHARLYKKVIKIDASQLGEHVYYHEIHSGGKDKPVYRQLIQVVKPDYKKNLIIAQNYTLLDKNINKITQDSKKESFAKLSFKDLKAVGEHCDSAYRLVGTSFVGGIDKSQCKVNSAKFGYLNLSTKQVYSEDEFWHLEEGFLPSGKMLFGREDDIPHKLRRVTNFKCWAAFKTDKNKSNGDDHWDFFSNITIHNQGDIAEFTTTDSTPKHYFIRLKETIFPAGSRPDVFEMFIHENSSKAKEHYTEALSYTWTNSGAKRLGLNLRWMQSSCSIDK